MAFPVLPLAWVWQSTRLNKFPSKKPKVPAFGSQKAKAASWGWHPHVPGLICESLSLQYFWGDMRRGLFCSLYGLAGKGPFGQLPNRNPRHWVEESAKLYNLDLSYGSNNDIVVFLMPQTHCYYPHTLMVSGVWKDQGSEESEKLGVGRGTAICFKGLGPLLRLTYVW